MSAARIGTIVGGSLVEGLDARLDDPDLLEQMRVGKFVVVHGSSFRFFSLITDVQLRATSQKLASHPPTGPDDDFARRVLLGTAAYGSVHLAPMLMLPIAPGTPTEADLQPVKTVPSHFAPVYEAVAADFDAVFGAEDETHFVVGKPLDNESPVCLDLARFVERSNAVFGKSGTGKSFLTRILLCGLIQKDVCGNLIFDMHNEYGTAAQAEGGAGTVKGLRDLFGSRVLIYTLDQKATLARGVQPDGVVTIQATEIGIDDIALLARELNLNETAVESSHILQGKVGDRWLTDLTSWESEELPERAEQFGLHLGALQALWRKLARLRGKPYIRWSERPSATTADGTWESVGEPAPSSNGRSVVSDMVDHIARGRHIILEFGHQEDLLSYLLVANVLTRAIRARYVEATERYRATQRPEDRPRQLMITIEEAHSFLSPEVARSTTFGQIAREMRKYSVTLLVVDQRPSEIEPEVLSQIGSRLICLLDDEKDVDAVLSGLSGANRLKAILATLESKQQALLLGYALPMPVVVATRPYDEALYSQIRPATKERTIADVDALMMKLFPR